MDIGRERNCIKTNAGGSIGMGRANAFPSC